MYKVGDRVFQIGDNLKCDVSGLNILFNILDNGFKFTPCFHSNDYFIFRDLLYYFENKRFILEDKNFIKNSLNNFQNSSLSSSIQNELNITNYCDSVDCFFKKIKKPINPSVYSVQDYTFEFNMEFFKNISSFKYDYKRNLSKNEINFY